MLQQCGSIAVYVSGAVRFLIRSVCFHVKNINTIKSYQQEKADCSVIVGLQLLVCFILHVCKNMGSHHQGHDVIRKTIIDFQCRFISHV
jgi:NADH:ubiquinone oxidoreductase subunit 6 (subunit J)